MISSLEGKKKKKKKNAWASNMILAILNCVLSGWYATAKNNVKRCHKQHAAWKPCAGDNGLNQKRVCGRVVFYKPLLRGL